MKRTISFLVLWASMGVIVIGGGNGDTIIITGGEDANSVTPVLDGSTESATDSIVFSSSEDSSRDGRLRSDSRPRRRGSKDTRSYSRNSRLIRSHSRSPSSSRSPSRDTRRSDSKDTRRGRGRYSRSPSKEDTRLRDSRSLSPRDSRSYSRSPSSFRYSSRPDDSRRSDSISPSRSQSLRRVNSYSRNYSRSDRKIQARDRHIAYQEAMQQIAEQEQELYIRERDRQIDQEDSIRAEEDAKQQEYEWNKQLAKQDEVREQELAKQHQQEALEEYQQKQIQFAKESLAALKSKAPPTVPRTIPSTVTIPRTIPSTATVQATTRSSATLGAVDPAGLKPKSAPTGSKPKSAPAGSKPKSLPAMGGPPPKPMGLPPVGSPPPFEDNEWEGNHSEGTNWETPNGKSLQNEAVAISPVQKKAAGILRTAASPRKSVALGARTKARPPVGPHAVQSKAVLSLIEEQKPQPVQSEAQLQAGPQSDFESLIQTPSSVTQSAEQSQSAENNKEKQSITALSKMSTQLYASINARISEGTTSNMSEKVKWTLVKNTLSTYLNRFNTLPDKAEEVLRAYPLSFGDTVIALENKETGASSPAVQPSKDEAAVEINNDDYTAEFQGDIARDEIQYTSMLEKGDESDGTGGSSDRPTIPESQSGGDKPPSLVSLGLEDDAEAEEHAKAAPQEEDVDQDRSDVSTTSVEEEEEDKTEKAKTDVVGPSSVLKAKVPFIVMPTRPKARPSFSPTQPKATSLASTQAKAAPAQAPPAQSQKERKFELEAPITGNIVAVKKKLGDIVEVGESLGTVSAMKLEVEMRATVRGKILSIFCEEGKQVEGGEVLFVIEASGSKTLGEHISHSSTAQVLVPAQFKAAAPQSRVSLAQPQSRAAVVDTSAPVFVPPTSKFGGVPGQASDGFAAPPFKAATSAAPVSKASVFAPTQMKAPPLAPTQIIAPALVLVKCKAGAVAGARTKARPALARAQSITAPVLAPTQSKAAPIESPIEPMIRLMREEIVEGLLVDGVPAAIPGSVQPALELVRNHNDGEIVKNHDDGEEIVDDHNDGGILEEHKNGDDYNQFCDEYIPLSIEEDTEDNQKIHDHSVNHHSVDAQEQLEEDEGSAKPTTPSMNFDLADATVAEDGEDVTPRGGDQEIKTPQGADQEVVTNTQANNNTQADKTETATVVDEEAEESSSNEEAAESSSSEGQEVVRQLKTVNGKSMKDLHIESMVYQFQVQRIAQMYREGQMSKEGAFAKIEEIRKGLAETRRHKERLEANIEKTTVADAFEEKEELEEGEESAVEGKGESENESDEFENEDSTSAEPLIIEYKRSDLAEELFSARKAGKLSPADALVSEIKQCRAENLETRKNVVEEEEDEERKNVEEDLDLLEEDLNVVDALEEDLKAVEVPKDFGKTDHHPTAEELEDQQELEILRKLLNGEKQLDEIVEVDKDVSKNVENATKLIDEKQANPSDSVVRDVLSPPTFSTTLSPASEQISTEPDNKVSDIENGVKVSDSENGVKVSDSKNGVKVSDIAEDKSDKIVVDLTTSPVVQKPDLERTLCWTAPVVQLEQTQLELSAPVVVKEKTFIKEHTGKANTRKANERAKSPNAFPIFTDEPNRNEHNKKEAKDDHQKFKIGMKTIPTARDSRGKFIEAKKTKKDMEYTAVTSSKETTTSINEENGTVIDSDEAVVKGHVEVPGTSFLTKNSHDHNTGEQESKNQDSNDNKNHKNQKPHDGSSGRMNVTVVIALLMGAMLI